MIDVQPPRIYLKPLEHDRPPRKSPDGIWLLALPSSPNHPAPIIDMDEDYGEYVVGAIERGSKGLETVYASPQYVTREEQAVILTKGASFFSPVDKRLRVPHIKLLEGPSKLSSSPARLISPPQSQGSSVLALSMERSGHTGWPICGKGLKLLAVRRTLPPPFRLLSDMVYDIALTNSLAVWAGADLTDSNKLLRRPARTYEEGIIANKDKVDAVTSS